MDSNELNKNKINRVATPIKIDASGTPITNNQNKGVYIVEKKKKESSLTTVFVVILLLILAFIAFLLFYIIIPDYMEEKDNNHIVKETTTTTGPRDNFSIVSGNLTETPLINTPGEYVISDDFKLDITSNGTDINVLVNSKFIAKCSYLSNNVALVHDLLLINLIGNNERSSKLYAIDFDGNIVYTLYDFTKDGMVLNSKAGIQYNSSYIIVSSSRVVGNQLILNNEENNVKGIDICDYKTLGNNDIDEKFPVISYYSLEYLGNHKFSKPTLLNSITLSDYRDTNNYCNN